MAINLPPFTRPSRVGPLIVSITVLLDVLITVTSSLKIAVTYTNAEFDDSTSLMYLEPSGNSSKYKGRNESVWIKGNEARVKWGFDSQTMNCKKKP